VGVGVGGLRIVNVAELRLPKTAFPAPERFRFTVLLLVAVGRIGILNVWLVSVFVKVNVPLVVV
jgi:hypothetical protein